MNCLQHASIIQHPCSSRTDLKITLQFWSIPRFQNKADLQGKLLNSNATKYGKMLAFGETPRQRKGAKGWKTRSVNIDADSND